MASSALRSALTDQVAIPHRLLPDEVRDLLVAVEAPPRLAAHLRAVHDAAHDLVDGLERLAPGLDFDRNAVLYGAATHDLGKAVHPGELTGPGSAHEQAGQQLLLDRGVPERLARFAQTHGDWADADRTIEDLLVALADEVWKGRRRTELEDLVVARIVDSTSLERWDAFLQLDSVLEPIAAEADHRLDFQNRYPVNT